MGVTREVSRLRSLVANKCMFPMHSREYNITFQTRSLLSLPPKPKPIARLPTLPGGSLFHVFIPSGRTVEHGGRKGRGLAVERPLVDVDREDSLCLFAPGEYGAFSFC